MPTTIKVYYTPAVFRRRLMINQVIRQYRDFEKEDAKFEIKGCHLDASKFMTLRHRIPTYLASFFIRCASAMLPPDDPDEQTVTHMPQMTA